MKNTKKLVLYFSLLFVFVLLVLPFSDQYTLNKLISFNGNIESKEHSLLSDSEMMRSDLINGLSDYFVSINYPELQSGLYYDNLSESKKVIIAIDLEQEESDSFRIEAYDILFETIYNEILVNKGTYIVNSDIILEPKIVETRIAVDDQNLSRMIVEKEKSILTLTSNYNLSANYRYFWNRNLSDTFKQIELDINGVKLIPYKIPLSSNDLIITINKNDSFNNDEKQFIINAITNLDFEYNCHLWFNKNTPNSEIFYNNDSKFISEINHSNNNLNIIFSFEEIVNKLQ